MTLHYNSRVGWAPRFRHHNAYFKGDRESLKVAMEEAQQKNPNKVLDFKMALEDGDRVAVFSHVKQNPKIGAAL